MNNRSNDALSLVRKHLLLSRNPLGVEFRPALPRIDDPLWSRSSPSQIDYFTSSWEDEFRLHLAVAARDSRGVMRQLATDLKSAVSDLPIKDVRSRYCHSYLRRIHWYDRRKRNDPTNWSRFGTPARIYHDKGMRLWGIIRRRAVEQVGAVGQDQGQDVMAQAYMNVMSSLQDQMQASFQAQELSSDYSAFRSYTAVDEFLSTES